jgi:hypothetical protein
MNECVLVARALRRVETGVIRQGSHTVAAQLFR